MRIGIVVLAGAVAFGLASPAIADEAARTTTVEALESGALAAGAESLSEMIAADADNADAQFGLGLVRFVQAVEHLSQGLYR
jgi:hypothetical protein